MEYVVIGVDNGVSGSIAILDSREAPIFAGVPTIKQLSYTKQKQWINRVDFKAVCVLFEKYRDRENVHVVIERPMINPMRFRASISAARSLETILICTESYGFAYRYIDSREWQKALLPAGLEGIELKEASLDIAKRMYPMVDFKRLKDADGLMIASYAVRQLLNGGNV